MDRETIGLIGTLAGLGVGLVGLAATLLWQRHRQERRVQAGTAGVAVGDDQHVGGSLVTGAGATAADRGGRALNITAQPGSTVNVYYDGLAQATPKVRDPFQEGKLLQQAEQHEAAIAQFEKALGAAENDSQRCAVHILIGNSLFLLGRLPQAEGRYREALAVARAANDHEGQAAGLGNLGLVYAARGQMDKAEEHHRSALEIYQRLGNRPGQAAVLGNLGTVYGIAGELDRADEHFNRALGIHKQLGDRLGQAKALANLGLVYSERGDLDKAEEQLKTALAVHEDMDNRLGQANQLSNLGTVHAQRGDLPKAEERFKEALAIHREIGSKLGQAAVLGNLGRLAEERGEVDKARSLLNESKALYEAIGAGGEGPEMVRRALERLGSP